MLSPILFAAFASPSSHEARVNTFMDAERAFSALAGEKGFRDSFLHFFAPEGIGFNPKDHVVVADLTKMEPEKRPFDYKMFWEPKLADCSAEGDLGFTTGPLEITDLSVAQRPAAFMAYFSIWKKMPNGDLRVVFDLGTPMKDKPSFPAWSASAPSPVSSKKEDVSKRALAVKTEIARATPFLGSADAVLYSRQFLAYRPGASPIFDSKDLREWQKSTAFEVEEGEVRGTFLSKNADLAWTWGTYKGEFSAQPATGYWVQIWKHESAGWRITADIISRLPQP